MIVYSIVKDRFSGELNPEAASKAPGRWNSEGTEMIYTCENPALCILELMVHTPLDFVPADYSLLEISVPDEPLAIIDRNAIPREWNKPESIEALKKIGDNFIAENTYVALKVPSFVAPSSFNYLLNPAHPAASKIEVVSANEFKFDERLFRFHIS